MGPRDQAGRIQATLLSAVFGLKKYLAGSPPFWVIGFLGGPAPPTPTSFSPSAS